MKKKLIRLINTHDVKNPIGKFNMEQNDIHLPSFIIPCQLFSPSCETLTAGICTMLLCLTHAFYKINSDFLNSTSNENTTFNLRLFKVV